MESITVKTRLAPPREGSANPQTRDTVGDLIVNLNSLNAEGNVFSFDNITSLKNTTIIFDTTQELTASSNTGSAQDRNSCIKFVKLGNELSSIGDYAFTKAEISSIEFPESVKEIGKRAFNNTKLSVVNIPETIEKIGYSAFSECSSLLSVTIPSNVDFIRDSSVTFQYAFGSCPNIEMISALCNFKTGTFAIQGGTGNTIITDKLKNIYLGKNALQAYEFQRVYSHELQPGEDPSLSAVQIYYYSTLLGTEALSAQEDSPLAVDSDGTHLSTHPVPTLGNANTFSTFQNYDIHVPTSMYKRWIAATNWNSISSHIYPYAPVSYIDPTMELEFDPDKTYIVTNQGVGSIAMNVSPVNGETASLSVYDIAEAE